MRTPHHGYSILSPRTLLIVSSVAFSVGASRAETVATPTLLSPTGLEYRHLPSATRFPMDFSVGTVTEGTLQKITSSHGVFAIRLQNGSVLAVPNANSPVLAVPALSNSASVHSARVLKYFIDAGLPVSEVGGTHVTTNVRQRGTAAHADSGRPEFVSYATHVDRVVQGIPVPSSKAWAIFNASDDVVSEEVFWPPIPADVIANAEALKSVTQDAGDLQILRAKIMSRAPNAPSTGGRVVIVHTPGWFSGSVTAIAAFELAVDQPARHILRFDLNGNQIELPSDGNAAGMPPVGHRK